MRKKPSINEILERVHSAADENGVEITFANSRVYLQLLEYVQEPKADVLQEPMGVRFRATTVELAEYCSVSARIITDSLRKFNKCGVIKYTPNRPNPAIVKLYKRFYE